ncbi:NAD(P)-dependent alcohol dehydrogenase [Novosphingobium rosa]|uniref:NAD(P)-dependent alcohol dehydrogenase n=1 Tax=Novosphingobium rosa TaxID=76978 RepID=UPI0008319684|nr:NAD(P)-dependent alcohol dehydrogenase [Novosphingobium rosa]
MPQPILAAVQRRIGAAPVLETLILKDPRADEVLVELRGVGVCHTDMVMRDGLLPVPMPVVLGHEGSGVVLRIGSEVTGLAIGDHVVLSFASCGGCGACHDHVPAYCQDWAALNFSGSRRDGSTALSDAAGQSVHSHVFGQSSFASHALVQQRNVVKVERDLPIELLGPLGCGIQTGAGTVLNALRVRAGSSVAVIGAGAVGLSAVMAAGIAGAATIMALDINPARVELALTLGATHAALADAAGMADHAAAAGCAAGFDYIIDTTGLIDACNAALPALAPRGELALVGAYEPRATLRTDATYLMSGGRVIRGVVEGGADPASFIPDLIGHYRAGRFPFDRLIRFFDFAEITMAIAAAENGEVVKPVLRLPVEGLDRD